MYSLFLLCRYLVKESVNFVQRNVDTVLSVAQPGLHSTSNYVVNWTYRKSLLNWTYGPYWHEKLSNKEALIGFSIMLSLIFLMEFPIFKYHSLSLLWSVELSTDPFKYTSKREEVKLKGSEKRLISTNNYERWYMERYQIRIRTCASLDVKKGQSEKAKPDQLQTGF